MSETIHVAPSPGCLTTRFPCFICDGETDKTDVPAAFRLEDRELFVCERCIEEGAEAIPSTLEATARRYELRAGFLREMKTHRWELPTPEELRHAEQAVWAKRAAEARQAETSDAEPTSDDWFGSRRRPRLFDRRVLLARRVSTAFPSPAISAVRAVLRRDLRLWHLAVVPVRTDQDGSSAGVESETGRRRRRPASVDAPTGLSTEGVSFDAGAA